MIQSANPLGPHLDLASVLLLVAAAQGLFMVAMLLSVRDANRRANVYLAALLAVCSIGLMGGFMEVTNYYFVYPHLIGWEFPTIFLYGPLLYLYVRSMTSPSALPFTRGTALHFLPYLVFVLVLIPLYIADTDTKVAMWRRLLEKHYSSRALWSVDPPFAIAIVQMGVYGALCYAAMVKHGRRIRDRFSNIERINLVWLRRLLVVFALLVGLFTVLWLAPPPFADSNHLRYVAHLMLAMAIYAFGFWGMRQPQIFQHAPVATSNRAVKYERGLDADSSATVYREIVAALEGARLYTNNDLSLSNLADQMSLSTHALSQAINQHSGANFYDLVNRYRVADAKRMLSDPAQADRSVIDIAYAAGFNSKSAFYAALKKELGITPLQYRQQQLASRPR